MCKYGSSFNHSIGMEDLSYGFKSRLLGSSPKGKLGCLSLPCPLFYLLHASHLRKTKWIMPLYEPFQLMIIPEWNWYGIGVRKRIQIRSESHRDREKRTSLLVGGKNVGGERLTLTYF
jgi:hypothetical protein